MQRKKSLSLATKLNLIVIAAILAVSVGLVWISFRVYCDKVDEINAKRMEDAVVLGTYMLEPGDLRLLWECIQSEGFAHAREEAQAAQDEDALIEWMVSIEFVDPESAHSGGDGSKSSVGSSSEHLVSYYFNLYQMYASYEAYLEYVKTSANISSAYIQYMENGTTYTLVDPELGLMSLGETEDPIPEFQGYGDNERVPVTVYNSKYGWLCTMCEPIIDESDGKAVGMLCFDVDMNDVMAERWNFLVHSLLYVILITAIAVLVSVYLIRRFATKPLRQLTDATGGFCDLDDENLENSLIDIDIRSNDEIGELSHEIRQMQERIVEHANNMARVTAEKERTKTEMDMARNIQESMLPNTFPCFTDRSEFDICALMDPAKDVGGDFFDFFLIDDNHLALVIADVSGKGVPAALFMMMVKIMIYDRSLVGGTPAEILTAVNALVCERNPTKTFVSAWMGILDIQTGKLVCTNAGHLYPWIRDAEGTFTMLRDKHGLVIGGIKRMKYADYSIDLDPGGAIFVYTDGVTEARDIEGSFFGNESLGDALNGCVGTSPEDVLTAVESRVREFSVGTEPFDDLTMLCLEYHGCEPEDADELSLPAVFESIPEATRFVTEKLDALACPPKEKTQITIAIDEIMSNIVRYAYDSEQGSVTVRFTAAENGDVAEVTFVDRGIAYNPLDTGEPDVTLGARERTAGGLGIYLVKKSMDDVAYERRGEENVLIIRKRIGHE